MIHRKIALVESYKLFTDSTCIIIYLNYSYIYLKYLSLNRNYYYIYYSYYIYDGNII